MYDLIHSPHVWFVAELLGSEKKSEPAPAYDTKDPLNKALVNLLSLFLHIASCSQVSQKTGFVIAFIEETVKAGPDTAKFVLNLMPLTLVGGTGGPQSPVPSSLRVVNTRL